MAIQAQLADGRVLEFPDGTDPTVIQSTVKRLISGSQPAQPSTERTFTEAATDVAASALKGLGSLAQFPGQVVKLLPGMQTVGEALETPGEYIAKTGEDLKSAGLKAREALRSKALTEAEKEGVLSQFATAITTTIKDPALLTSFISEQVPLLIGPLGAAKVTQLVGRKGVAAAGEGLTGDAATTAMSEAAKRLNTQAARAAIGTGAAMQGSSVGSETYENAFQAAVQQGMSPEQAKEEALKAARIAAGGATATSLATAGLLSRFGGTAIERRLAGVPGMGRAPSAVGEATSEALEESGGQLFQNIALRQIDPNQSLTAGVGAAAGLGALGGGFFGGLLGKKPDVELAPGQKPGETLAETAQRLNQEIKALDEMARMTESDQTRTDYGLKTNSELVDMYRTQGAGAVKQYQQQLAQMIRSDTPVEQKVAAAEAVKDIQNFLTQTAKEEYQRKAASVATNVMTEGDVATKFGIPRNDPIYRELVGKDLAKPQDAEVVVNLLQDALNRKGLRAGQRNKFDAALQAVNAYLETVPGSGFYAATPVQPPSGEGAGVAGVTGERPAAPRAGEPEPTGVVRPETVAGELVGGEGVQPPPVEPAREEVAAAPVPAAPAPAVEAPAPAPAAETVEERYKRLSNRSATMQNALRDKYITREQYDAYFKELEDARAQYREEQKSRIGELSPESQEAITIADQLEQAGQGGIASGIRLAVERNQVTPDKLAFYKQKLAQTQQVKTTAPVTAVGLDAVLNTDEKDAGRLTLVRSKGQKEDIDLLDQVDQTMKALAQQARDAGFDINDPAAPPAVKRLKAQYSGLGGGAARLLIGQEAIIKGYKRANQERAAKDREELKKNIENAQAVAKKSVRPETEARAAEILKKREAEPQAAPEAELSQADAYKASRALLVKQLDGILKRILAKYGLKDVKLNIDEALQDEGSYARQVITLALNIDNPVRTLRHESIHALKDMGFFTDAQWKTLTKRAETEWIQALKDRVHSPTQSRYDAYIELFNAEGKAKGLTGDALNDYVQEALIEEAIADAFGEFDAKKAPPGLMQSILNRMRNLFKAIKEAFGQAGIDSAEDIFGKIEEGKLKPIKEIAPKEAAPEEAKPSLRIVQGKETPEIEGKVTVDKVGKYFDDQIMAQFGRRLDYNNPQDFERAVKQAFEEVSYQIKQENSGLDWYEDDIKAAFKDTAKIIPALKKAENRVLFSVMAGIMSPQTTARDNWYIAAKAFEHYVDTKDIPGLNPENGKLWMGGTQSPNKKIQLEFLDRMVKDMGQTKALEWLMSDHTVKEINEFRSKYGNIKSGIDGKLTDVKPGLYAFGPKVGPFVSNINGIHDVTVDKWMTRTFNRYFGTMIGPDGKIIDAPTEPQRRAVKELVNKVAEDANVKPYQVQSLLWFYEQKLFSTIGTTAPSYGFSDGATKFVEEARGRGREEGVEPAPAADEGRVKPSLRTSTDTPQFKFWFGKSTIVDKDGNPKVMYHGTARDIEAFQPKQANAIFLTDDPRFAEGFAYASEEWIQKNYRQVLTDAQIGEATQEAIAAVRDVYSGSKANQDIAKKLIAEIQGGKPTGEAQDFFMRAIAERMETGPNIIPVYVKAENPFDYENPEHVAILARMLTPESIPLEENRKKLEKTLVQSLSKGDWDKIERPEAQAIIRQLGFDGFYIQEGGVKNLAIYNPNQVKSVFNQAPTEAPELRKSLRSGAERFNQDEIQKQAKPGYKSRYKLIEMPIDDFLSLADAGIVRTKTEDARAILERGDNFETIPFLKSDDKGQVYGHEGRHRARALKDLGYTSMPVELRMANLRWSEQLDPNNFDYEKDWPETLKAQEKAEDPSFSIPFPVKREDSMKPYGVKPSLRSLMTPQVKATVDKIAPPTYTPNLPERILNAVSGDTFTKIRQAAVNRYERLAEYDRRVAREIQRMGGVQQLADSKAETAALFSDLGAGILETAMGAHDRFGGVPVFKNGVTVVSNFGRTIKGPIAIFKPLSDLKDPDVFRLYQTWSAVKRGSRLNVEGREQLIDQADIAAINAMERANPQLTALFKEVQKDWLKYNNALVKYMVDTGVITPAMAKEYTKHGDYFPFYRLVEEDVAGPKMFTSIGNVRAPKKLKGGEGPLGDFFENIIRNSQAAIQAGIKNTAAQRATEQALRLNEVTRLDRKATGASIYRVLENGQEVFYQAHDPLFIEAIKALNMPDLPFIGLLAGPANLLRNLVTKDPAFMLANMMRDSLSAYVTSGVKMTPLIDTFKNFGKAIAGQSPELEKLYAAGVLGGYDYSRGVATSGEEFQKRLREVSGTKTTFEKITSPATSLWGALEKGTQASDAATRMEVFKRVLAETGNEAEAYWQALEVMNFNRKGNSPVVRVLTAAIPFLNARMQGLDLLFRTAVMPMGTGVDAAKQRMKTFWVRGMTLMALSSMYWLLTHDDEDYKKQEQETKDNFWLIPSLGVKIPIPFEVGVMFKVIPERFMQLSFGTDTNKDFTDSMKRQFVSTFGFNLIPQAVLPFYEVKTNHSFFTDRPIIGKGLEDVAPQFQIGPSTSRVAELIGTSVGFSPIKVDHLIKGYTGTIGQYAADLFDMVYDMNSDAPKASKRFEQMPIIRRFAVDPEARGAVTAYYGLKDQVDEVVRSSNLLERSMNFKEYGPYMTENIKMLAAKDYLNDLEKTMKDYREMRQVITSSTMSADAKRDALKAIGKMESSLTANIQTLKKQVQ